MYDNIPQIQYKLKSMSEYIAMANVLCENCVYRELRNRPYKEDMFKGPCGETCNHSVLAFVREDLDKEEFEASPQRYYNLEEYYNKLL